ncbi:MAG TPA: cyclic pyranopterin monophosphate synthase MoaC [Acidimicrobiales bacterium]|nr:cyclic pyranopterin monophosphate synthase MoaC [Acidimicrobiales bacterium]
MAEKRFSHVDGSGKMRMVDVSRKRPTLRTAHASCLVRTTAFEVADQVHPDGIDPLHAARLAGIQAAKQTANLIPLCHPLDLNQVLVDVTATAEGYAVSATIVTVNRTGVEMEALTACAFCALSLVSSIKRTDPNAWIDELVIERKSGGKSGDWGREVETPS